MATKPWFLALGLSLLIASSAGAQVTGAVLEVNNTHMS
jgi:hypothetical protein